MKGDKKGIYYPKFAMQMEHPQTVCRSVMIRNQEVKYIKRTSGDNELYYLKDDPREIINRYSEFRETDLVRRLEFELSGWYLKTADIAPLNRDDRGHSEAYTGNCYINRF